MRSYDEPSFVCPRCGSDQVKQYWLYREDGAASCTIGCPCGFCISGRAWDPEENVEAAEEEEYMVGQIFRVLSSAFRTFDDDEDIYD